MSMINVIVLEVIRSRIDSKSPSCLAKVPVEILNISPLEAKEEKLFKASIKAPVLETQENVSFRIALEFYDLLEGFQGNKVKVKIAE